MNYEVAYFDSLAIAAGLVAALAVSLAACWNSRQSWKAEAERADEYLAAERQSAARYALEAARLRKLIDAIEMDRKF